MHLRSPYLDRDTGEARAGADVYHMLRSFDDVCCSTGGGENVPGSKEGFAKVAGYDFFRLLHCSEIDASIPGKQYIDIHRYTPQLNRREPSRRIRPMLVLEERHKQFRDA